MTKSIKTILAALALAMPLALTSCEGTLDDIFGEWDKPSSNTNTNPGSDPTPAASETYIVYTAAGVSTNEVMPTSGFTEWTGTVAPGEYGAGIYVVSGTATCAGKLTLTGDVKIILKDNASLTVDDGIIGFDDNENSLGGKLTVYAQSTGDSKGQLIVNNNTPIAFDPGYPTYKDAHAIYVVELTIHGGKITTTADTGTTPCSSGSGLKAKGGDMAIYAGEIINQGPSDAIYVGEGNLNIHGGTITTIAKKSNNGIYATSASTLGNINITGGSITATGAADGICAKNITIDDGTVTANGGDGGGEGIRLYSGSLVINGGTLIANGGEGDALIPGGGDAIKVPTFNINGGTITATGGNGYAAVSSAGGFGIDATTVITNCIKLTATGGAAGGSGAVGKGFNNANQITIPTTHKYSEDGTPKGTGTGAAMIVSANKQVFVVEPNS